MKRLLTAGLLIPPAIYLIFWAHPLLFLAAQAALALLCYHEYRRLVAAHGFNTAGPFGYAAGLVILRAPDSELLLVALLVLLALILSLRSSNLAHVLPQSGALILGVVYIFCPWRFAGGLREASPHWLLFALVLNWVGDVAAYYVGRTVGRHKLAPRLSPAKTWEGATASMAASVLFGAFYLPAFIPSVSVFEAIALTAVANVAGQLGDISESAIKRGAGVKDSGTLLPGHGGLLDRVDSSLFSLPVVYFWLIKPWQG